MKGIVLAVLYWWETVVIVELGGLLFFVTCESKRKCNTFTLFHFEIVSRYSAGYHQKTLRLDNVTGRLMVALKGTFIEKSHVGRSSTFL